MPMEVVALAPRRLVVREYEEPPLKPNEVRVRSMLSSEKHGTNLAVYRGVAPTVRKVFDPKMGIFLQKGSRRMWPSPFPMLMGNMTVGLIVEVGREVKRFKVGDRVYGYLGLRETHTVPEDEIYPAPPDLSDEELVCIDPMVVALMAIREGNVKLGERVAIFGLGAIGLMATQMARISGSTLIVGVEPFEKRRKLAERYGADITLNPEECDAGLEIRRLTGGKGVDISIEASGSYNALHQAIRATAYGGTVVPVSWYHGEAEGLNLGEEWHFNRQIMVSGARVESEPYRDHPRWDRERIYRTVIHLLRRKKLTVDGLLDPIVNFEDVIEAYKLIDEEPEKTIKLAVRYEWKGKA